MAEVTFTWKYGGNEVHIHGSFSNWTAERMNKDERGVWYLTKHLPRGAYQYKFTVDGRWCYDIEQKLLTDKGGHSNNVISVDFTIPVPFWWKLSGKRVYVSGTFNNWTAHQMDEVRISESSIKHYKEISLPLGFYQYKFISDDRWGYDDHQPHNYFDGVLNNYRQVNDGQTELYYFHSLSTNIGLQYLGYLPQTYSNGSPHPLLLYLHEANDRGDNIQLIEQHGIPEQLKAGKNFEFIVLAPQCPRKVISKWTSLTQYLYELVEHFCNTRNVDRSRLYVTGPEMGAYGAWKLVTSFPNLFAAVAVFAGEIERTKVKSITHLPIWACDDRYGATFNENADAAQSIRNMGGSVEWRVNESGKKDFWNEWYASDQLYDWFKRHRNHTQ